jgi:alkaline phosphatase D
MSEQFPRSLPTASRRDLLKSAAAGAALTLLSPDGEARAQQTALTDEPRRFRSAWETAGNRTWIGPEYWANRLQDWCVQHGRLECLQAAPSLPMRTVHLLTRRITNGNAEFAMTVRTGVAEAGASELAADAATGFLIGAGGDRMDYRAAALIHSVPGPGGGLFAGMDGAGRLFIRDFERPYEDGVRGNAPRSRFERGITLRLDGGVVNGRYTLTLSAADPTGKPIAEPVSLPVEPGRLVGNIALVSHPGTGRNSARFWFADWIVAGPNVGIHDDRAWGPILATQYTVHNRVLKLTAQLAPVDAAASPVALLQVLKGKGTDVKWTTVATAPVITPGYTAQFRVERWDTTRDYAFRVVYWLPGAAGQKRACTWSGTIRRDPSDRDTITVASLSGVQQVHGQIGAAGTYRWADHVWFPHADMVPNVAKQLPDLFFFAGDQVYEDNPTRVVREPEEVAHLDYLYRWFLWCWTFGDLVRHTPCVCLPDDHDAYQGNLWGDGGRPAAPGDPGGLKGGYGMPPTWLNMMQRTQTSHLPDPVDPTPAEQGIGVYFTALTLGGIGFAILEDRKFKSSPDIVKAEKTLDSHIIERDYDTRKADVPGAQLLGERQLRFLRNFAEDWRGQEMKAVLSQTIFCNLQISSRGATVGQLAKDLASGGWPQSGRAAALREMRRGFMIHLAGDQHLASTIHHGIDDWEDGPWSLCSPAIASQYVRYWNPNYPPVDGKRLANPFSGRYEDGFHNQLTVHCVANPVQNPRPGDFPEPMELHRMATGYAIVRFNKRERTIRMEVWPRYADPTDPKTGSQYPGWPITIRQMDNYRRRPEAYLPEIHVKGMDHPVIQVVDENDGEPVYTLRIRGERFRPHVFREGSYTVKVGELGTRRVRTLTGIRAEKEPTAKPISVRL